MSRLEKTTLEPLISLISDLLDTWTLETGLGAEPATEHGPSSERMRNEEQRLYSCFGNSFSTQNPSAFFLRTVKHAMPVYSVLYVSINAPAPVGCAKG